MQRFDFDQLAKSELSKTSPQSQGVGSSKFTLGIWGRYGLNGGPRSHSSIPLAPILVLQTVTRARRPVLWQCMFAAWPV